MLRVSFVHSQIDHGHREESCEKKKHQCQSTEMKIKRKKTFAEKKTFLFLMDNVRRSLQLDFIVLSAECFVAHACVSLAKLWHKGNFSFFNRDHDNKSLINAHWLRCAVFALQRIGIGFYAIHFCIIQKKQKNLLLVIKIINTRTLLHRRDRHMGRFKMRHYLRSSKFCFLYHSLDALQCLTPKQKVAWLTKKHR